MESECNRGACFTTCCVKFLLGVLPVAQGSPPRTAAGTTNPRHDFASRILSSIHPNASFTNHESIPSSPELLSCLASALPQFLNTVLADNIRAQEYYHLSTSNWVCLDYIGQGLFSYSQKGTPIPRTEIASSSTTTITDSFIPGDVPFFDISHSAAANLHSYLLLQGSKESELQSAMRRRIMRYMNLFEQDYSLVFTAHQSSAFKLLADSYPFQSNQALLTVYDHENAAIEGMIESAKSRGARAQSAVFSWPNLRVNSRRLRKVLVNKSKPKNRGLFVFPLHSRVTGSPYSYQWMNLARENGWHVVLDGCALRGKEMETLGLSLFQPDFLICSFYKVFGSNPTGFCCLFIKNTSAAYLGQSPVTMGIINLIPPQNQFEQSAIDEDEPINQEIQQLHGIRLNEHYEIEKSKPDSPNTSEIECRALDHADTLGLILISSRVRCLINWLINAMLSLRHPHSANGLPLVRIFGPKIKLGRGPAIAFNVYDWEGARIEPNLVQKLADRNNISISCGFLKNMWFPENYEEEREKVLENGSMSFRQSLDQENRKKVKHDLGFRVVSASIGMLSNFEDVYRFWGFVARFLDADFVEKERWRYAALNQTTVEA